MVKLNTKLKTLKSIDKSRVSGHSRPLSSLLSMGKMLFDSRRLFLAVVPRVASRKFLCAATLSVKCPVLIKHGWFRWGGHYETWRCRWSRKIRKSGQVVSTNRGQPCSCQQALPLEALACTILHHACARTLAWHCCKGSAVCSHIGPQAISVKNLLKLVSMFLFCRRSCSKNATFWELGDLKAFCSFFCILEIGDALKDLMRGALDPGLDRGSKNRTAK